MILLMRMVAPPLRTSLLRMPKVTIETAVDCDGIRCGQPLFNTDGELNYVAPHSHLIEWLSDGPRYHVICCDFPDVVPEPIS